jgi:hypothetical protein
MSAVNVEITVDSFTSEFVLQNNEILVQPDAVNLTCYAGFAAFPPEGGAGNGKVLFNDGGLFAGSNTFLFDKTGNGTLTVDNVQTNGLNVNGTIDAVTLNVIGNIAAINTITASYVNCYISGANLGVVSNVSITGGNSGQFLRTDGTGNLTFANVTPGGAVNTIQYNNNYAFDGIANFTFDGSNISLGNAQFVKLTGGTNGQFLQTDGAGNLIWQTVANVAGGNGVPSGANLQVQFNKIGQFGGDPGFDYNYISKVLTVPNQTVTGNITVAGNVNISGALNANLTAITNGNSNVVVDNNGNVRISASGTPNVVVVSNNTFAVTGVGSFTGNLTANGDFTANGNVNTFNVINTEGAVVRTGTYLAGTTPGTLNISILDRTFLSLAPQTGNTSIINIRGNATTTASTVLSSTGKQAEIDVVFRNTANIASISSFQIDSTVQTVRWRGGTPPTGTANQNDWYTFVITRTNDTTPATYIVYGRKDNYN